MSHRVAIVSPSGLVTSVWLEGIAAQHTTGQFRLTAAAMERLRLWRPDLIICDISGLAEFPHVRMRELRALYTIPLLIIGSSADEKQAVRALKLGADGYLAETVGAAELEARVSAHLRRYWEWAGQKGEFASKPMGIKCVDPKNCSVTVRNRTVKLSPTECRLLSRLAQDEGQAVSREELGTYLWGSEDGRSYEGMVSLYIHYLRKKLEDDLRYPRYIRTKRGGGYYLNPEGA